jgi:hypothetical protein
VLQKVFPAPFFEPFDDFGHILGAIAGADEQCVGRFHDNQVAHADGRNKF